VPLFSPDTTFRLNPSLSSVCFSLSYLFSGSCFTRHRSLIFSSATTSHSSSFVISFFFSQFGLAFFRFTAPIQTSRFFLRLPNSDSFLPVTPSLLPPFAPASLPLNVFVFPPALPPGAPRSLLSLLVCFFRFFPQGVFSVSNLLTYKESPPKK